MTRYDRLNRVLLGLRNGKMMYEKDYQDFKLMLDSARRLNAWSVYDIWMWLDQSVTEDGIDEQKGR